MAKLTRIIPFGMWPANWGLAGERLELARAEYYNTGEDLDRAKAKITKAGRELDLALVEIDEKFNKVSPEDAAYRKLDLEMVDHTTIDYHLAKLKLDQAFKRLTEEEAAYAAIKVKYPDDETPEYRLAEVELDLKFKKISQDEADKRHATINEQPWFRIIGGDHKMSGDTTQLTFELDWNDIFVEQLAKNGFGGRTDEEIVDLWFSRTCRETMIDDLEQVIDEEPMGGSAFARTRKERNGDKSTYS